MTDPDADRAWAPKPLSTSPDQTTRVDGTVTLPGYSDFQLVAEGGEGTVYRARQDGLDRFVAVKVLSVGDSARLARFRRELEITVRLGRQHPHIVTVIDTGATPDGRPCIVMEYYDAGSLADRLRAHGPLPVPEVVAAGVAVADALAFAHGQGFLHRDVKPQNILVLPTSYVLADFGIARMADAGHSTSLQMLSYRHAAPQMIDGAEPSAADDLWSLGSTLFTLLDGAPPFASENPDDDTMLAYLGRVRSSSPRPVRRSDVPPELAAILARCMSKERDDRFPSATALRTAFAAVDTTPRGWTPSLPIADFGPRPAPPLPEIRDEDEEHTDSDRTVAGPGSELAGLTVRIHDTPPVPVAAPPWPAEEVPPPRRKGRRALLFGAAAIVIGIGLGVLGVILNERGEPGAQPPAATSTTKPSTTKPPTTKSSLVPTPDADPAYSPVLAPLADDGDRITLTWTDPTGGNAQFIVVDVTNGAKALVKVAAGNTTYTVTGLSPAARQYCFMVLAISLADIDKNGGSAPVCTAR